MRSESDSVQAIDPVTGDLRANLTPPAGDSQTRAEEDGHAVTGTTLQRAERLGDGVKMKGRNDREE